MKFKYFLFIGLTLSYLSAFPHPQGVHQYIVKEAYMLLINQLGGIIPNMHDHVGEIGSGYQGSYAWQKPYITTGAWREDEEDPIFNYDFLIIQGTNIALLSITHFWDADDGDLNKNLFPIVLPIPPYPSFNIGPYENAYDKLRRYSEGDWVLWYQDSMFCTNKDNGHQLLIIPEPVVPPQRAGVPVKYFSITDFYNNRELNLLSGQNGEFLVFDLTTLQTISAGEAPNIIVEDYIRNRISWEVLGRMCHLLADLSVPAHTHRDEHGLLADSYESWIGGPTDPYLQWNNANSGPYINPFTNDNDPLHYLMYTMQQQADHFGSNGPDEIGNGNNNFTGDPKPEELILLNSLNIPGYGEPITWNGPWNVGNLENIRDKTFPYLIRATAGLLFWFAVETMLITNNENDNVEIPLSFLLNQNYPNPFNPSTKIGYRIQEPRVVSLEVYDILGKEVTKLVNEEKSTGFYEVVWDASGLPSGVYFYQLRAGSFVETKKMILMK